MPGRLRFLSVGLASVALVLVLAACGAGPGGEAPTPTIVLIPAETKAAVETAQAATRFQAPGTPTPPPASTPEPTATAAGPDVTATISALLGTTEPEATGTAPEPSTTTPAAGTGAASEHVVKWGDNLTKIAQQYGVTVQAIAEANGLDNPSAIYIGQTLVIPAGGQGPATPVAPAAATPMVTPTAVVAATNDPGGAGTVEHVVKPGENLAAIAWRYGVTVADLVRENQLANPSVIWVGQVLRVPTGTQSATPVAEPSPEPAATEPAAQLQATEAVPTTAIGGGIAFQTSSGGPIYWMRPDGSDLQAITNGLDPALSPDGGTIAFARWEEPRGLYLIGSDGSNERLIFGGNLIKSPTWSGDGSRIAFVQGEGGSAAKRVCVPGYGCVDLPAESRWRLSVVNADGSGLQNPTSDLRSLAPSWNPSSDRIVYQGENGLKIAVLEGQAETLIADGYAAFPAVSPDGAQVALMYQQSGHWEVYVAGSDGSGLRRLTESSPLEMHPANNVAPCWSPDGTRIVFLSDRDGYWRPYVMGADGSDQRPFLPTVLDRFQFQYEFANERVFSWR